MKLQLRVRQLFVQPKLFLLLLLIFVNDIMVTIDANHLLYAYPVYNEE